MIHGIKVSNDILKYASLCKFSIVEFENGEYKAEYLVRVLDLRWYVA